MVAEGESEAVWWVYVLACADGTYYTGSTTDVARRLAEHAAGRGARYTRGRRPLSLVGSFACADRAEAARLEAQLKALSRRAKERYLRLSPAAAAAGPDPHG